MKQSTLAIGIIIGAIVSLLVVNSAFIVDETEQVIITHFGKPIREPITEAGLNWRLPVAQTVHRFEKRILEWDGEASEVPTGDKKFILLDLMGRWKIKDPLTFFKKLHSERNALQKLNSIMEGNSKDLITKYRLSEIVRSSNRILESKPGDVAMVGDASYEKIKIGRDAIAREILEAAQKDVLAYGIELVDIRVKRINYSPEVQSKVFERMISERKQAAEGLRSEGQAFKAEIEGEMQKELKRIQSEAYREAQTIRGAADAEAIKIYGEAYSADPEFYAFSETLKQYPHTLKDGRLLLTTDSDFLKYLKETK